MFLWLSKSGKKNQLSLSAWVILGSFVMWLTSSLGVQAAPRPPCPAQNATKTTIQQHFAHEPKIGFKKTTQFFNTSHFKTVLMLQILSFANSATIVYQKTTVIKEKLKMGPARQRAPPHQSSIIT